MARGWESKSVESQIESAQSESKSRGPRLTTEEANRLRERESLELSRKRVLHDLGTAVNPRYREILQSALAHLDKQLTELL